MKDPNVTGSGELFGPKISKSSTDTPAVDTVKSDLKTRRKATLALPAKKLTSLDAKVKLAAVELKKASPAGKAVPPAPLAKSYQLAPVVPNKVQLSPLFVEYSTRNPSYPISKLFFL